MEYFKLWHRFWQLHNQVRLKAPETALYCFLLAECNSLRWKNPFGYTNAALTAKLGLSEKTLISARKSLQTHGLLTFQSGRKNCPTTYRLLSPNTEAIAPANTAYFLQPNSLPSARNASNNLEKIGSSLDNVIIPISSNVVRQYERTSALASQSPALAGLACNQAPCGADESPLADKVAFAQIVHAGGHGNVDKELYRQQMLITAKSKQVALLPAQWHKWITSYLNNERRRAPLLPPQSITPPTMETLRTKSNPHAIVL